MGPWGQQCLQTRAGIQGTCSLPELLVQRVPELLGWWGFWSSQDGDRETVPRREGVDHRLATQRSLAESD